MVLFTRRVPTAPFRTIPSPKRPVTTCRPIAALTGKRAFSYSYRRQLTLCLGHKEERCPRYKENPYTRGKLPFRVRTLKKICSSRFLQKGKFSSHECRSPDSSKHGLRQRSQ